MSSPGSSGVRALVVENRFGERQVVSAPWVDTEDFAVAYGIAL
jgi:hypothetical protein